MGDSADTNIDTLDSKRKPNIEDDLYVSTIYKRCLPIVLILFVIVTASAVFELYHLFENENQTTKITQRRVASKATETADQLSHYLAQIPPLVDKLASQAEKSIFSKASMHLSFESLMRQNNALFEVGLAFNPTQTMRRKSPHYGVIDDQLKHFELDYDYTSKDWYKTTIGSESNWFEPYYGQTTQAMVVGYAKPFKNTLNGISQAGVARANISLNGIRRHLNKMDLGENGYTFILSAKRKFIYHPIHRYVRENLGLDEAEFSSDETKFFNKINQSLNQRSQGIATMTDPITNKSAWVVYTPITESEWTLISVNIEDDLIVDSLKISHLHKARALVLITISVLLLCLYMGMKIRSRRGIDTAWLTSLAFSFTLVTSLVFMGHYFFQFDAAQSLATITNIQELNEITKKHSVHKFPNNQEALRIPTGAFIQSIEFRSSNNVFITGYVWQKTPITEITPGILFPEAVAGSSMSKIYTKKIANQILTGWYFETVFRQPFDYSRYPLDKKDVWIRMWHGNFEENVILVPDLSSYVTSAAELTPGIEESIVLSGWSLQASGFQYVKHNYNASFGFPQSTYRDNFPELHYTVRLERTFIDAFVTNLVPLIVVSIMLFAILLTITNDKEKAGLFGADAFSVVTTTAGLFFIVLVAHIQLRKEFALPNIIYLEYFYLVMYIAILWVSVSAFLVTSSKPGQLMHYREGLFAKIFYWPMILTALLLISYNVFI